MSISWDFIMCTRQNHKNEQRYKATILKMSTWETNIQLVKFLT